MSSIFRLKGKTKTNGIEIDGATLTNVIDTSGLTSATYFAKLADGKGAETTVTSPVKVNASEQGYVVIDVGGTAYYIPYWA